MWTYTGPSGPIRVDWCVNRCHLSSSKSAVMNALGFPATGRVCPGFSEAFPYDKVVLQLIIAEQVCERTLVLPVLSGQTGAQCSQVALR
jgi:hypothetical protein